MIWILLVAQFASAQSRPAQDVFDGLRGLVPRMCEPASTLRVCYSVNKETCDGRVMSSFENCLRDQRIKFAGQPVLDQKSAKDVEDNLKKCVLEGYAMASATSYRKTADCEKWVPKVKKAPEKSAKDQKSARADYTAFEDPLEGQRDLLGRYKLRLLHDSRVAQKFKEDLAARKDCRNDKNKRESNLSCYKRLVHEFPLTSSVQITALANVAVQATLKDREEGIPPSNGQFIDASLAAVERVQLDQFHLWNFHASSDSDRVLLNQLRVDDEKLLRAAAEQIHLVLSAKLKETQPSREPASVSDLRVRLDALKARVWRYNH